VNYKFLLIYRLYCRQEINVQMRNETEMSRGKMSEEELGSQTKINVCQNNDAW